MGKVKMTVIRALFAALAMLPLLAQPGAAQDYRLRSGDVVQIEVLEDGNLNRSAIVLPDGQISVPMAGSVRAAGRSLAQVQADLSARLAPNFATPPTVYVTLSELAERPASAPAAPRTLDIFVLGAAIPLVRDRGAGRNPPLPRKETLRDWRSEERQRQSRDEQ